MTKERAQEVVNAQAQWPSWGNFRKHMTPAECEAVACLWQEAHNNGPLGFAAIVYRIAQGRDPITGV